MAVGVGLTVLLAAARLAIIPLAGEGAPYAFVFAAVVGAVVLAGWRSGLFALILGQTLIWVFALEPYGSLAAKDQAQAGGLMVATFSQIIVLVIIALYQREVALAWSKREGQLDLLEKALREIDHRTSNNYQTVLALILAQAKTAKDGAVKDALNQVADRIRAIANASKKLALSSHSLEEVRIDDHLEELCGEIARGLARPGVNFEYQFEDMVLNADQTVCVSILVNELATNALKHAYPDGRDGEIRIDLKRAAGGVELSVADDGVGMDGSAKNRGTGLGKRLIDTFVKQLAAEHEVVSDNGGTRHLIRIPA